MSIHDKDNELMFEGYISNQSKEVYDIDNKISTAYEKINRHLLTFFRSIQQLDGNFSLEEEDVEINFKIYFDQLPYITYVTDGINKKTIQRILSTQWKNFFIDYFQNEFVIEFVITPSKEKLEVTSDTLYELYSICEDIIEELSYE